MHYQTSCIEFDESGSETTKNTFKLAFIVIKTKYSTYKSVNMPPNKTKKERINKINLKFVFVIIKIKHIFKINCTN